MSVLVFLSAPVFNPMLTARFECRNLWEDNPVHDSPFLQVKGDLGVGGRWGRCWQPWSSEALSPGCHGAAGCGTGQEDFITQRSVSVQDMSLKMPYLWKSAFLLTNQVFDGFLLKQQPPPGQVNVTVAAVSIPRGLPASRIQLDPFVCKCFKYFSWYAIKE